MDAPAASAGFLAAVLAIGVAFVLVPVGLYVAMAPDHARFIGTCEGLPRPDDAYGVMLRIDHASGGAPAIEVLDPLCPACKAFEQRLAASGLAPRIDRRAVLFPLDNTCNWMVTEATHPGACTVSEAVLCAGAKAPEVIAWAFEVQDRIRNETRVDPGAAARIIKQRFPELASCVGSPEARSRLNKSLRWIVANNIRVLTPQLFVDKVKLCDEDVDLGLEYTLSNMLDRRAHGKLATVPLEKPPAGAAPDRRHAVIAARAGILVALLAVPVGLTGVWIRSADGRLAEATSAPTELAPVASAADVGYCSPELKRILRRVLMSCGLVGGNAARGCQPVQARSVATMSGHDFNALFKPMQDRGGIVQFDQDKHELDAADLSLVDHVFSDQRGASWFFVVARASPEGSAEHNRELSKQRAEAVMTHLREQFKDPDLDKEVGMLWLGEEYAQLETEFCAWKRSSSAACNSDQLNRSAFVAWIDCQL